MPVEVITTQDNSQSILREIEQGTKKAELESARAVEQDAKANCPKRTGNLASTIEAHDDGSVTAGGAKAPYGFIVHEGGRGQAGRPFLSAAFDAERDRFEERMREV